MSLRGTKPIALLLFFFRDLGVVARNLQARLATKHKSLCKLNMRLDATTRESFWLLVSPFCESLWQQELNQLFGGRNGAVVRALVSHEYVPGSIPGPGVISGLSLLLVHFSAPRDFFPGTPVFSSPQKPTFPNSSSSLESVPICTRALNALTLT